ncbi:prolyl oligopeptidase family serine peptidase, partial [uncultured Nostoc sp.]|uniref:prolyl oligopeptidase family serine peptidase n=1 Tax=uncultured Nostoc sp. TaxID=340711 RepID=UPI0035CA89F6
AWIRDFFFTSNSGSIEAHAGDAPVLIRIETKAGHGAGKPTAKIIEEAADKWAFLVRTLNVEV